MKIYKIDFTRDYDMFSSFVVRAENEEEVVKIIEKAYPRANEEQWNQYIHWEDGFKITELKTEGESEILSSTYDRG